MKNFASFALAAVTTAFTLFGTACATDVEGDDFAEDTAEALVRPTFDVWRNDAGQFYFHLEAANGEILLGSQGYDSRTAALTGMLSVLDNGGISSRYVIEQGADSQWYLSLKAANNRVIATGEGYSTKSNATRAVTTTIRNIAAYLAHWDNATGARYQVKETSNGQFVFNLYAGNGAVVLTSETYTTEASALNGAFAVDENGRIAARYEVRTSASGTFYFVLKAANNQVIGVSEQYSSKSNAERAVASTLALVTSNTAELL